ncbi:RmlC-like cupin [Gonapodya prolifera JEL478]|uniref:homogentisate 1,2-dioxygenase n=1 Tax=Gonapodya prolifera (strain JEL478) TaxID=1344416 RepID=A0A139AAE2_GONPJ|nr:RmlC-like cupin [Gonapodya prolifera JEL478]|eukprot:KXS13822.1 RmlC-like cupin [Gonapodya prolifera JEL478]
MSRSRQTPASAAPWVPSNPNDPYNFSGTAFTAPRKENQRVWMYRMVASVAQSNIKTQNGVFQAPNQTQWSPFKLPGKDEKVDFIDGLKTLIGARHPVIEARNLPQLGRLDITTELGKLSVALNEICVIQSGLRFSVELPDGPSRRYVGKIYSSHFELPDLGPIGANGLANPRDFMRPTAWFEHDDSEWEKVTKYGGKLFGAKLRGTPYNVLGWHGPSEHKAGNEGQEIGLFPGGGYVHTMMGAHGPEAKAFETFATAPLEPARIGDGSQPFMFESYLQVGCTKWAWSECGVVQEYYVTDEWGDIQSFDPTYPIQSHVAQ